LIALSSFIEGIELMRILFLSQIVPWPPNAGPKIKTWQVLKYLSEQGHEIVLVTFVRKDEREHLSVLNTVCSEVHDIPLTRSRIADLTYYLKSMFTKRPFLIERDDLPGMRTKVTHILESQPIDVVHTDQLTMAQFAIPLSIPEQPDRRTGANGLNGISPRLVFDAHNATWLILKRMVEKAPWYLKPVIELEARRVKRYEGQLVRVFDHTVAVTQPDARALQDAYISVYGQESAEATSILVIPITVDSEEMLPLERLRGSHTILTMGTLHYPPNADGIRWFANEVFPLVLGEIPDARLRIVGKNPPKDFLKLQEDYPNNIIVTGYVEDLIPCFKDAGLVVVPVRAGGGMRVRILEALARGMPIVTTTIGLEGIEAEPGEHVLVGDSPVEFATRVIRVLKEQTLQEQLARNGRELIEKRYDFRVVLSQLDRVYAR
jgi:glycosyltransferase involved in cell wall biosynthesis